MQLQLRRVLLLTIFLLQPLYSHDIEPVVDTEQQAKAAIAALADPNSKQAIGLWNALGTFHQEQRRLSKAEQDYRQALALNRGSSAPSAQIEASIINNLATVLQARRDFKAADILLKQG